MPLYLSDRPTAPQPRADPTVGLPRRLAGTGIFYGWWIVLAAMALELVISGLFLQAYGAYLVLLRSEFGWSATILSLAFALTRVEQGLLAPLQGWLVDKYGPRRVVNAGVGVLAVGYLLLSQVSSLETFFAAIFVMAIGASLGGFSSLAIAVVNWFERRRATALGLLSAGFAASSLVLPVVVLSLALFGWRATAALSALATLLVAVPAAQVLRHRPELHGLLPDGAQHLVPSPTATDAQEARRPDAFTLRRALRARRFWYLSAGHACAVVVVSAVMLHLVPHLTGSLGLTLAEASGFVVVLSMVTLIAAVVGGAAGDRFDRRNLLVACMGGHALGILILGYASAGWMVVAFALLHGLAWGVRGPLMSSIRADYFGRTAYGTISGVAQVVVMLGMVSGPLIAGLAYDLTGSYVLGFNLIAGVAVVGAGFFVLASRAAPPSVSAA